MCCRLYFTGFTFYIGLFSDVPNDDDVYSHVKPQDSACGGIQCHPYL